MFEGNRRWILKSLFSFNHEIHIHWRRKLLLVCMGTVSSMNGRKWEELCFYLINIFVHSMLMSLMLGKIKFLVQINMDYVLLLFYIETHLKALWLSLEITSRFYVSFIVLNWKGFDSSRLVDYPKKYKIRDETYQHPPTLSAFCFILKRNLFRPKLVSFGTRNILEIIRYKLSSLSQSLPWVFELRSVN